MDRRLQLHDILLEFLPNVYFQPPPTMQIIYPCIVYTCDTNAFDAKYANSNVYLLRKVYTVTIIEKSADSLIPAQFLVTVPYAKHDRFYISSNLYHNVFTVYY